MNKETIRNISAEIAQAYLAGKENITVMGITLTTQSEMLLANGCLENILNVGHHNMTSLPTNIHSLIDKLSQ